MPSSSKVHKTCSSPSILRMMEESGGNSEHGHRDSSILDDESSRKSLNQEDEASRRSLALDEESSRQSLVFEDKPSRQSLTRSLVLEDEPSRVSLVLDDETSWRSFAVEDTAPSRASLTCGEVDVERPVINAAAIPVSKVSLPVKAGDTLELDLSSQEVNLCPKEDDKDNKDEDVLATPLSTPFGAADDNADESAVGGGGGFSSILKSFWKRTSFVWDDQKEEEEEAEHCGDKEAVEEAGEVDAAGSESKQTEDDVENDFGGGDGAGYRCGVQEVTETPFSDDPLGRVDDDSNLVDPSESSGKARGAVNKDSGIPGK